jgi:NAD(P)-dependent dehydrogenase (short-subunit alcohol dehydrogenase family)
MLSSDRPVALITGANQGLGYEVARQLGKAGQHVLLGARDQARGEAAAAALRGEGMDVRPLLLDVTDSDSIAAATADIEAEEGRLDVLVNNAGIRERADGPPSSVDLQIVRRVFNTNFFAAVAVAQAMLPLLRRSAAGRIVNVSSGLGSLTRNGDPLWEHAGVIRLGYNAAKAALNMLTVQLAAELQPAGIKVNSADPGFTATEGNNYRGKQTVAEGAAAIVRLALLDEEGPTGGFFGGRGSEPW